MWQKADSTMLAQGWTMFLLIAIGTPLVVLGGLYLVTMTPRLLGATKRNAA